MCDNSKVNRGRNQLRIRLRRKYTGDEAKYDLLKLPVEALYSEALRKIGEQGAYIEELEDTIKKMKVERKSMQRIVDAFNGATRAEREMIRREEMYGQLREANQRQREKIKSLNDKISELITRIVKYEAEINSSRGLCGDEL